MSEKKTVKESKIDIHSFCRKIPKAELHVHFTGALPLETFMYLAKKNDVPLPQHESSEDLYRRGGNFDRVLKTLKLVCQTLLTAEDFHLSVYDTQKHAAECGIRYREMFWNPTDHWEVAGITYNRAVDGMIAGLREAESDFGIIGRLIPSIDRESSPELGLEMVEAVIAHPREEVVGIGMDYLEVGNPPEKFWKAYHLAGRYGLKRTAHAGEWGEPARNIETAIDLLGCDRIDHGYTVFQIDSLLKRCRDEQILFTIVPTNSYYNRELRGLVDDYKPEGESNWTDVDSDDDESAEVVAGGKDFALHHPISHMAKAGLKIMPNSDDPPLHHTDPANAYAEMVTTFNLPLDRLREFVINGIDGAWVDEKTRSNWRKEWLTVYDELVPNLNYSV